MNFYDVLAAEKWGGGIPTINFFDLLFAQYMGGGEQWQVYEGTLPATLNANGSDLRQYQVWGNTGGVGEEVDITGLSEPLCGIGAYTDSLDLSTGILTRRIKKLVLTGQENWYIRSGYPPNVFFFELADVQCVNNYGLCTHYSNQESGGFNTFEDKHLLVRLATDGSKTYMALRDSTYFATMSDFKSYIAQFYANGNPITVWYVLAEPEVSTITIPSGLTGTLEGYLIQDGTPTPETPIYPAANGEKQADDTYSIKGYKVDIGVKSAQMFDKNAKKAEDGYLDNTYIRQSDGSFVTDTNYYLSEYISVEPNKLYTWLFTFSNSGARHSVPTIEFLDASKNRISWAYHDVSIYQFSVNTPTNCAFIRASVYKNTSDNSAFVLGLPDKYQPYSNTVTPIYIGDDPLEKDEYVDYQAEKIYRRTTNLFDENANYENGYYTSNGIFVYSDSVITYDYFPVEALTEYFYKAFYATPSSAESERTIRVNFFDSQKSFISRFFNIGTALSIKNVTTPKNCTFVRLSVNKILSNIVFGTALPETYVPYLQPTDPPVPLPALPTVDGETVVDYAGQSIAPEKVYFEYKGGKQP